jgi:hypothetical protein
MAALPAGYFAAATFVLVVERTIIGAILTIALYALALVAARLERLSKISLSILGFRVSTRFEPTTLDGRALMPVERNVDDEQPKACDRD